MKRALVLAVLLLAGCGPASHTGGDAGPLEIDAEAPDVGSTAQALIGPAGGTIALEGARLEIPADALREDTLIRITVTGQAVQDPFVGFSPIYRFEPAGLRFEAPVTVSIPFAGDPETATLYWTVDDTDAFAALETTVESGLALAQTEHFSRAFVGTACRGDCCGRGRGTLDVLLSVDNSNSMAEEQALLAAQIPHMARVFATGDIDGDGVQDVPALRSVRIGTVSADMGTGGYAVPTCDSSDFGDDGLLNTDGRTDLAACMATYPPYAELGSGASTSAVDGFVDHVRCTAQLGTGGCGFEQQLEGVVKAVTPSSAPLVFHAGTTGHGDGANAGFVRRGSILSVIMVTDENDCSALDPELFNPSSATYGATDLNLRCYAHPSALHDVRRYVDGLRAMRGDPSDVVFSLIGGVPADLGGASPASILADSRMSETVDPSSPNRLLPACISEHGIAMPARRLVEVAQGLPGSTVHSICEGDFAPAVDAILQRVADRASGSCGAP